MTASRTIFFLAALLVSACSFPWFTSVANQQPTGPTASMPGNVPPSVLESVSLGTSPSPEESDNNASFAISVAGTTTNVGSPLLVSAVDAGGTPVRDAKLAADSGLSVAVDIVPAGSGKSGGQWAVTPKSAGAVVLTATRGSARAQVILAAVMPGLDAEPLGVDALDIHPSGICVCANVPRGVFVISDQSTWGRFCSKVLAAVPLPLNHGGQWPPPPPVDFAKRSLVAIGTIFPDSNYVAPVVANIDMQVGGAITVVQPRLVSAVPASEGEVMFLQLLSVKKLADIPNIIVECGDPACDLMGATL